MPRELGFLWYNASASGLASAPSPRRSANPLMLLRPISRHGPSGPLRAKGRGMKRLQSSLVLALVLTACVGDPAGPALLAVGVEGAGIDTVWVGAPGQPLPSVVRLHVTDDEGRALPRASLEWQAIGQGAQV